MAVPCVVPAVPTVLPSALLLAMSTQEQANPAAPSLPVANHPLLVCTEEQASSRAGQSLPKEGSTELCKCV